MTFSRNEIEMALMKACRGAGLDIGQAQGVARAVACDASHPVIADFLDCLANPKPKPKVALQPVTCTEPWMVRDFLGLADAALSGHDVVVQDANITPLVIALASYCGVTVTAFVGGFSVAKGEKSKHTPMRSQIDPVQWDEIHSWAAKTYVQDTDDSRLSGAGAGLTDND